MCVMALEHLKPAPLNRSLQVYLIEDTNMSTWLKSVTVRRRRKLPANAFWPRMRDRDAELARRLQNPPHFADGGVIVREVLEHLRANNCVKRVVFKA